MLYWCSEQNGSWKMEIVVWWEIRKSERLGKFVPSLIFHFSSLKLLRMVHIWLSWIIKKKKPLLYFFVCFKYLNGTSLILFRWTENWFLLLLWQSWLGNGNFPVKWENFNWKLYQLNDNIPGTVILKVHYLFNI